MAITKKIRDKERREKLFSRGLCCDCAVEKIDECSRSRCRYCLNRCAESDVKYRAKKLTVYKYVGFPKLIANCKRWKSASKIFDYRLRNLDNVRRQLREYNARWQRENKERSYARGLRWKRRNPLKHLAASHRRRAKKAGGYFSVEQFMARASLWGGLCAYCDEKATAIDHTIALSRGGTNWPANLKPICKFCNSSKKDRTLTEWLKSRSPPID